MVLLVLVVVLIGHPPEVTSRVGGQPVRAATPGQSICFYDGEYVLGGGVIVSG